jgi:hypothetical protein
VHRNHQSHQVCAAISIPLSRVDFEAVVGAVRSAPKPTTLRTTTTMIRYAAGKWFVITWFSLVLLTTTIDSIIKSLGTYADKMIKLLKVKL